MERKEELGKVLRMMDPDELRVLVDKMRPHVGNQRTLEYAMEVVEASEDDFDGESVFRELESRLNISEEELQRQMNAMAEDGDFQSGSEVVGEIVADAVRRLFRPRAKALFKTGRTRECDELVLSIADALEELDTVHSDVDPDVMADLAQRARECVAKGVALRFFE